MSLIVEDGTEVAGAESYITVANADTYHENRGNTTWDDLDTPVKEQLLRKATDYMLQVYRPRWKGVRMTATQSLDWPRAYVYTEAFLHGAVGEYPYLVADDIVPTEVQNACAVLALKAYSDELSPDKERGVLEESVGPISVKYDKSSPERKRYNAVDDMLRQYLNGMGGAMVGIVRA